MISTKLNKNAAANQLLIEFSDQSLHPVLQKFYLNCVDEGVLTRRTPTILPLQMNLYLVQLQQKLQLAQNFTFFLSVFYINSEEEEKKRQQEMPKQRSLLLRQSLDVKFFMDYEFENTQSEQESLIFLCELSANIINTQFDREISFYDQNITGIKSKHQNQASKFWINILFQIPGLGEQKCKAIAQKYPNYQALLEDYHGDKTLPNMKIQWGLKEVRLGNTVANRIYKSLFGSDPDENILAKKS